MSTDLEDRPHWFCLRTRARREHVAATHLRERVGIEVFAPRIRMADGGAIPPTEPLFPGYLFARFRYPQQLRHVAGTCGVFGVVTFGPRPPTVASDVIEHLRRELQEAGTETSPALAVGSWVRIASGCFRDSEGRVLASGRGHERVRVLLTFLGRDLQVSVPRRHLRSPEVASPTIPVGLRVSQTPVAPVAG